MQTVLGRPELTVEDVLSEEEGKVIRLRQSDVNSASPRTSDRVVSQNSLDNRPNSQCSLVVQTKHCLGVKFWYYSLTFW